MYIHVSTSPKYTTHRLHSQINPSTDPFSTSDFILQLTTTATATRRVTYLGEAEIIEDVRIYYMRELEFEEKLMVCVYMVG
jgi:hypothetical protein